ncbi:MAG: hypothetical protein ACOYMV_11765 [Verrucomicrobiia bacterium]
MTLAYTAHAASLFMWGEGGRFSSRCHHLVDFDTEARRSPMRFPN